MRNAHANLDEQVEKYRHELAEPLESCGDTFPEIAMNMVLAREYVEPPEKRISVAFS
jgi:hypothetical protein